jgi:hypothetical protein
LILNGAWQELVGPFFTDNFQQEFVIAPTVTAFVQMVLDKGHEGHGRGFINGRQLRIFV